MIVNQADAGLLLRRRGDTGLRKGWRVSRARGPCRHPGGGTVSTTVLNHAGRYGVMVAARGEATRPVKLEDVAGRVKTVPPDHGWITSARRMGTNLGD